jgi:hypothetical protein
MLHRYMPIQIRMSDPDWTDVALRVEATTVSQPVLLLVKF